MPKPTNKDYKTSVQATIQWHCPHTFSSKRTLFWFDRRKQTEGFPRSHSSPCYPTSLPPCSDHKHTGATTIIVGVPSRASLWSRIEISPRFHNTGKQRLRQPEKGLRLDSHRWTDSQLGRFTRANSSATTISPFRDLVIVPSNSQCQIGVARKALETANGSALSVMEPSRRLECPSKSASCQTKSNVHVPAWSTKTWLTCITCSRLLQPKHRACKVWLFKKAFHVESTTRSCRFSEQRAKTCRSGCHRDEEFDVVTRTHAYMYAPFLRNSPCTELYCWKWSAYAWLIFLEENPWFFHCVSWVNELLRLQAESEVHHFMTFSYGRWRLAQAINQVPLRIRSSTREGKNWTMLLNVTDRKSCHFLLPKAIHARVVQCHVCEKTNLPRERALLCYARWWSECAPEKYIPMVLLWNPDFTVSNIKFVAVVASLRPWRVCCLSFARLAVGACKLTSNCTMCESDFKLHGSVLNFSEVWRMKVNSKEYWGASGNL